MYIDLINNVSSTLAELLLIISLASDFIFKSGIIVAVGFTTCFFLKSYLHPATRHLIWLIVLACIILLPIVSLISTPAVEQAKPGPLFDIVEVSILPIESPSESPNEVPSADQQSISPLEWDQVLLFAYLAVFFILLCKLVFGALSIHLISKYSESVTRLDLVKQINQLKKQLGICRTVTVKFSDMISSPVSFGLFQPVVIFPRVAEDWPQRTFNSALIHELSHIGRMDWLASTSGYVFSCLLWFNPFTWYSLAKINSEAESATDMAVLKCGISRSQYAEDILSITQSCRDVNSKTLFAQHILPPQSLKTRIVDLLNSHGGSTQTSVLIPPVMIVVAATLLMILGAGSFLHTSILNRSPLFGSPQPISIAELATSIQINSNNTDFFDETIDTHYPDNTALLPRAVPEPIPPDFESVENVMLQLASDALKQSRARTPITEYANFQPPLIELGLPSSEPVLIPGEEINLVSDNGNSNIASSAINRQLSRAELEAEITRVQEEFYRVFNLNVEDKSLRVICGTYRPLGSFITKRYCEPQFVIDNRSLSLRERSGNSEVFRAESAIKGANQGKLNELTDAMNLALNNDPFLMELHLYLTHLRSLI